MLTYPKVLIADDEEEVLELLGEYLRARGYVVETAYDGQAASERMLEGDIDVVLADLKMPHAGGLELLAATNQLARPVAVVLMSAYATTDDVVKALKAGAFDFLQKPFRLSAVHTSLQAAAARVHLQQKQARDREMLAFYERVHDAASLDELPALFGTLARVAQLETGAEEVAVWIVGQDGWDVVARGGRVHALRDINVGTLPTSGEMNPEAGWLAVPLYFGNRRIGAVAVAGGAVSSETDAGRLQKPGRALRDTLARLKWKPPSS